MLFFQLRGMGASQSQPSEKEPTPTVRINREEIPEEYRTVRFLFLRQTIR